MERGQGRQGGCVKELFDAKRQTVPEGEVIAAYGAAIVAAFQAK
jgi:hypothetical protein